ncbi:MAG: hypothetical protein Solumvirus3_31 [Solumvirus sp.]|uniref:Uncharacterized protein n=1 Tax=Solumvirus sp. TaxID=2487773 RepID=A0A3G5AGF3_9VIRU|nr:MAG: hypothetical protein Solumvirus3_31 [Solumvirus sp.]
MSNLSEILNLSISQVLEGYIFGQVVELSKKKNAPLNVDDLRAHFKNFGFTTASAATVTTVASATRSKTSAPKKAAEGQGCQYVLTRGMRKGQACGATIKNGGSFCTPCSKKGKGTKSGKTTAKATNGSNFGTPSEQKSDNEEINIVKWEGKDSLFTQDLYFWNLRGVNYLIRPGTGENEFFVVGKTTENSSKAQRVPITEAEAVAPKDKTFKIDEKAFTASSSVPVSMNDLKDLVNGKVGN